MTPSENNNDKPQGSLAADDNGMPLNTSAHAFFNGGYGQPYEKCEDDWLAENRDHVPGLVHKDKDEDSNVWIAVAVFGAIVFGIYAGVSA